MTSNQIAYWNLEETKRHNQSTEGETARHNLSTEGETSRHNRATEAIDISKLNETIRHNKTTEAETHRSNLAMENENQRHNVATETETSRSNQAREAQNLLDLNIKAGNLAETERHNKQTEMENTRSNKAREAISWDANRIQEEYNVYKHAIDKANMLVNQMNAETRKGELSAQNLKIANDYANMKKQWEIAEKNLDIAKANKNSENWKNYVDSAQKAATIAKTIALLLK